MFASVKSSGGAEPRPYGANKECDKKRVFASVKSSGGAEPHPYGVNKKIWQKNSHRQVLPCGYLSNILTQQKWKFTFQNRRSDCFFGYLFISFQPQVCGESYNGINSELNIGNFVAKKQPPAVLPCGYYFISTTSLWGRHTTG